MNTDYELVSRPTSYANTHNENLEIFNVLRLYFILSTTDIEQQFYLREFVLLSAIYQAIMSTKLAHIHWHL